MQVELRDGVILHGARNRVTPVGTVYIHSVASSSVALVWEDVDLFPCLAVLRAICDYCIFFFFLNRPGPNSGSQSLNLEWSEYFPGYKGGAAI